jgi:Phytanoyl-CoA dioxygenase (PhyH)
MITVDWRTRAASEEISLDVSSFVDEHAPTLLDKYGIEAGHFARRLALLPLTLDVGGESLTFAPAADGLTVRRGGLGGLEIALDHQAFSDLMQDRASTFALSMAGRATVTRGALDDFLAWEPVLRSLVDGRPAFEPGSITFRDRDGSPLDLQRSFRLGDDRDDVGHFLAEAGFLHLESVFTEAEMAAVSEELDQAIAAAERDDGASWWARTDAGEWYPSRILGLNQKSATLRSLLDSERFAAIGTFTDNDYVQRDPNIGDTAEGLLKKIGVVEGISDVSWHKDCSMGGHSRTCCSLTVGISVTGAGPENGELGVVAGSHRANVAPLGTEGLDLPRLPLASNTGDITVHCSCTLHMSRPPISAERRVVYSGFDLALRPGDRPVEKTAEEIRRDRARLNDQVRRQQQDRSWSATTSNFEL